MTDYPAVAIGSVEHPGRDRIPDKYKVKEDNEEKTIKNA